MANKLMTMPQEGLRRTGIAIALAWVAYAILAAASEILWRFLRWLEFLSPVPGLSGLAVLAVTPVAFLLLAFVARWVLAGFNEPSEDRPDLDAC